MSSQNVRNPSQVDILSADFQRRWEPNFAWVNALSAYTLLPQGVGHWSTAISHENGDCHDEDGHGVDAAYNGTSTYNVYGGLAPYFDFSGAAGNYLSVPDRAEIDITGLETFVAASLRGLSMACWVWFDALGALAGVMSKWVAAGNMRAYRLIKTAANALQFDISSTGANTFSVTGPTVVANTWYHVVCRFTPSTELLIQVNGEPYTNLVAIPASIFGGSNAALDFGRSDGANYLNGRGSMFKLARAAWPGAASRSAFWQTCAMFGVVPTN